MQQQQQGFVFPPAGSSVPLRHVAIPTSFKTAADYKAALLAAMTEEVRVLQGGICRNEEQFVKLRFTCLQVRWCMGLCELLP
jgi:hypothetical protein